ncbi:RNA-binding protein 10 [Dunckerocampus dactyliophorus]|uniref:RNA-binding protein 10 n=1 Tax=Dunckerocampus dactyliophorus TaxID=161453 RepID=UPI0024061D83|nr:RNA-binding protein 10 [Dunckerocampus dactyliophorus]
MWDGPGQGPRGRPPFRGNHHGDMFGRDRPMPDFRGREGMMGPMGHMGPRPLDLPPMDMRRMEGPPLSCHDMDPRDVRGREPHRDYYRPDHGPDFSFRGQYDGDVGDNTMNAPGFYGPSRNSADMGGRDMQNSRFMDMGGRDTFPDDMPWLNYPNMDERRGFPMERVDNRHVYRDTRPPMGIGDNSRFNMDMSPRERRMMDLDRRGPPPFNQRGGFDSDMDFRNHPAPQAEFGGRERSPLRFGNDVPPKDRTRSDIPVDASKLQRSDLTGTEHVPRMREGPDSSGSPLMDYRSGEEMTLAEEWKKRQKDKTPYPGMNKSTEGASEPAYPSGFRRDVNSRDPPPFAERDRPPFHFPGKDVHFSHGGHFAPMGRDTAVQDSRLARTPLPGTSVGENKDKHWLAEKDSQSPHKSKLGEPFHLDKNMPAHENVKPNDSFKGLSKGVPHSESQTRGKVEELEEFQSSSIVQARDQDYRDIDYRTGSGRNFEYKQEDLQATQLIKESKPAMPLEFSESGSKDQDYRNASVEDKVSTTISIFGIPKTATMEQILGAFTVEDGVPQQGMKIKSVVPGYSYDTAYVEFLNLEDAVHFMESNKGSLKVGTRAVSMSYSHPEEHDRSVNESHQTLPSPQQPQLSRPEQPLEESSLNGSTPTVPAEPLPPTQWQRNSDLTPEAWQQQVDQQFQQQESEKQAESWGNHNTAQHNAHQSKSVFKDSKTMIIKNIKPTTTVETILKALDPFAYLDERNVRLIKAKTPGAKCFCFVDMDSHEQVTRLVDLLLTKPVPLYIDDVRVYAEVARPLKNQNFRREPDKPNSSSPGYPPPASMMEQQQQLYRPPPFLQPPPGIQAGSSNPPVSTDPSQGMGYDTSQTLDPSYHAAGAHLAADSTASLDQSQSFMYDADTPDMSNYLYDSTSGFYYDPETTLYFDPGSRYFYNAQNQEYLYWDAAAKMYVPVPGGTPAENQPVAMTAEDQAILSNPAADAPLDMKKPSAPPFPTTAPPQALISNASVNQEAVPSSTPSSDKKEDDESARKDKDNKEERPKSLAAVKIMKDMERWAKIQNRQKEGVRAPSPLLKSGEEDDRRQSKSADAGFAIFERKNSAGEDLFKKPLAPPKKESKRPMGSLGMLASDYAAGSDEEVEEDKEDVAKSGQAKQCEDKEDKLTDWKKMACLLCRRQFPNKDALIRHQQLSDLHKQNMEIHLKIKRSKKELEALENQEKELSSRESVRSPEQKKRKHHHHHQQQQQQQSQHHNTWAGGSRETSKVGERPGLGSEAPPRRQKKEHAAWDHATYKQAVRKAMFARFKELE